MRDRIIAAGLIVALALPSARSVLAQARQQNRPPAITDAAQAGPDYLLQFVIPRTVTENTLRRGFAPKVDEGV